MQSQPPVTARSLTDRLTAVRGRRYVTPAAPPPEDRADRLARWFSAQISFEPSGTAVVVQRRIALSPAAALALQGLPDACYFDTETTGLSTGAGTVIFMAGLGRLDGDAMVVRQYLLPDYQHENALLRGVAAEIASAKRVVTYNGRGFDMPLLATRLTVHGLFAEQARLPAQHDDLLPIARRLWRRPLGGARLADVEAGVLGVHRDDDCPGAEVPARYFGYVRGGSPDLLAAVLDHNLQDIVSLALIEAELVRLRGGGWRRSPILDQRGMALDLLRGGAGDQAMELLDLALTDAGDGPDGAALRRLATRLLLAAGEIERAEMLWRLGTRRASIDAATAWIEVARIRERHRDDLVGALEAVTAASRVLDLAFALGRGGSVAAIARSRIQVEARLRRLRRWVAAAERRAALRSTAPTSREQLGGGSGRADGGINRAVAVAELRTHDGREGVARADHRNALDAIGSRDMAPADLGCVEPGPLGALSHDDDRTGANRRTHRRELRGRLDRSGRQILLAGDEKIQRAQRRGEVGRQPFERERLNDGPGCQDPQPALEDRRADGSVGSERKRARSQLPGDRGKQNGSREARQP